MNENLIVPDNNTQFNIIKESNVEYKGPRLQSTCVPEYDKDINMDCMRKNDDDNDSACIVNNLGEYYKSRLVINCNGKNCLYFRLLSKWDWSWINDERKLSLYHLIMSETFNIVLCATVIVLVFIGVVMNLVFAEVGAYFGLISASFLVADIMCMCMMVTGNITMFELIRSTFDFWFINWNVINIVIARIQLRVFDSQPMWYFIFRIITLGIVTVCVSTFDAICIPTRFKMNMRIVLTIYLCYLGVNFYFTGQDFVWNPFKQLGIHNSEISYKSVYLSGLSNLTLFTMKPMFKQFMAKCCCAKYRFDCARGCTKVKNRNSSLVKYDKYYQRCECLYKKPFVQYNDPNFRS